MNDNIKNEPTIEEVKHLENNDGLATSSESPSKSGSAIEDSKGDLQVVLAERKRKREINAEIKRLAAEKYDQEIKDQRYKRLMHLLDRSQFYSNYLVQKINESMQKDEKKSPDKRKMKITNENSPPKKKPSKLRKANEDYDLREYVDIKDIKVKAEKKRLNRSQEKITSELINGSDEKETTNSTEKSLPIELKYFVGQLRDYQIDGLKWLKVLYENGVNGILADEMGLGKTIQVIALICHLIEKKIPGPYLIIAPLSTIPNWMMEFEIFAPKIPVVLFYGRPEERQALYKKINTQFHNVDGYQTRPVVLTTFETPLAETHFLSHQKWRYIIIDEGHRIKNYQCQLLKVLKRCQSLNRLLLTGTPLQNNLSELWSLLNFLLPEIFNDLAVFESWFDAKELQNDEGTERILKQEAEKKVLTSLREILKPFMLRRVKADVCLDIPPKKEIIVYAPLTELQHSLYKAVLTRDISTMSKINIETLIIPEVDGKRPKRKCRLRTDLSEYTSSHMNDSSSSSRASTPMSDNNSSYPSSSRAWSPVDNEDIGTWKKEVQAEERALSMWTQFTDITDRNREFLVRIQFRNRGVMYKKIVNHPYLVHCPLNDAGLPKVDEELIKSSGKLLVLDAMFAKLKARGHKVLLFSTMTMILDMIEDYLEMRDYRYVRLDGNSKIEERKKNIKAFNSNPNIFLFLISTRAGGVGLNLTAADTVIIYDSDWNPQVDIQAMARCHRIGQTRPVVVYKLCTKGTIDEKVINRAEAKRKLEKIVISEDALSMNLNNVETLVRLKNLLESSENHIVRSENEVFTDKELDDILDRSDLRQDTDQRCDKKKKSQKVY